MQVATPMLADLSVLRKLPQRIDKDGTYIIIGYSEFASILVRQLSMTQVYRILLVDDSDSEDVHKSCIIRPHRLSHVCSVSYISNYGMKRPYWNESLLALSLASSADLQKPYISDAECAFNTYLGYQAFNASSCYGDSILISEDLN